MASPLGVRYSPGYPARSRSRRLHWAFATRRETRRAHAHAVSIGRSLLAGIPGSLTLTPSPLGVRYSPGYPARSRSCHPPGERLDDARRAVAAFDLDRDEHLGLDAALHVG